MPLAEAAGLASVTSPGARPQVAVAARGTGRLGGHAEPAARRAAATARSGHLVAASPPGGWPGVHVLGWPGHPSTWHARHRPLPTLQAYAHGWRGQPGLAC